MQITKDGDVIIHKETWETLINDEHYRDLAEEIKDLEDHFIAMKENGRISFDDYVIKREKSV